MLNPKIILEYGVFRPFGETQIVKQRKAEARNEMDPPQILTIKAAMILSGIMVEMGSML